jgi:hypothetical protein
MEKSIRRLPLSTSFIRVVLEHFCPQHTLVRRATIITTINKIVILGILQFTLDGLDVLIVGKSLGARRWWQSSIEQCLDRREPTDYVSS